MRKLVLTTLVAGLVLAMVGQASAVLYEAHALVDTGASYTQKSHDRMMYLNPSGGAGGGTITWSSYHDTVRTWDLSQGFVSATAMTDLGNPYSSGLPATYGAADAGYVAVTYSVNKLYDDSSGPWQWKDGTAANAKMGYHGVGSTEAFGRSVATGGWWVYDFTTGTESVLTNPGASMNPSAMNNNNDKVASKYSGGYLVRLWDNASSAWANVATTINQPADINDAQVIIGQDETTRIGYAYDVPNAVEYQIPFMTYNQGLWYEAENWVTADRIYPTAINNNGLVVGYQYDSTGSGDGRAHGFLWDINNPSVVVDLHDASVTDISDITGLSGFGNALIHHPYDINDDGVIVARTQAGGYLIVLVPEPATLGVLLVGGLLALLRGRRR